MTKLPVLISAPHAGEQVPAFLERKFTLSREDLLADIDEGAREIYDLEDHVAEYITTNVARPVLDLNRAPDDFRPDGVIKSHTCFQKQIWSEPPDHEEIQNLLKNHYYPYHRALTQAAERGRALFGVDCHTMLSEGPPIGPGAGIERPLICISNGDGTISDFLLQVFGDALSNAFGVEVSLNDPFKGGYIIRKHGTELPWIQLELSRKEFAAVEEKRACVLKALREFCAYLLKNPA